LQWRCQREILPVTVTISDVFIRRTSRTAELTDDELMARIRKDDSEAFRQMYDRYKGQIFIYCLRMLNDRDMAKDVLQEVFIRIHTRRETYEPGTNFNGWIHTIARNLSLNARRDMKDHASFDEQMSYAAGDDHRRDDVALREHLAEEIARLPEIYREALILREYEGYAYQEIADALGVAMSTIKFRIFKAREILRERLAWSLDELPGLGRTSNSDE
jgi:RNA polymerase sigma-70 factor (ECF subfamily)